MGPPQGKGVFVPLHQVCIIIGSLDSSVSLVTVFSHFSNSANVISQTSVQKGGIG